MGFVASLDDYTSKATPKRLLLSQEQAYDVLIIKIGQLVLAGRDTILFAIPCVIGTTQPRIAYYSTPICMEQTVR